MRYCNPHQRKVLRGITHFLLWRFGYYREKTLSPPIPVQFSYPNPIEDVDDKQPTVTWVNHSTFWIQAYGKSILIDPIWSERCSPLPFMGPRRYHPPMPNLDAIDSLDVVVISHNHYDHLDRSTVASLLSRHPHALWILPAGVKKWFTRRFPQAQVTELSWWEFCDYAQMRFTAVPAQHFSGRGLFDRNQTLWMGCVVEFRSGKRVYFVGDTGYNAFDFKKINNKFSHMDLSLIPIGVYKPRAFMQPVHVNPSEAVKIHCDVKSKLSIASHFGTFRLSSEEMHRPPFDLYCVLQDTPVTCRDFRVLNPGQTVNW